MFISLLLGGDGAAQLTKPDPVFETEPDPVSEVMSALMEEFKAVTLCDDDDVCRTYIELGQMDLNQAIEAYIHTMSWWPAASLI